MKPQNNIDFDKIDWSKIGKKKAKFIYNEAIARLDFIHKGNEDITNKATNMLSFSMPILTALTGYFIFKLENISIPFLAMSICAIILLFAILVLLLLILLPKAFNSAQGGPSAYLTEDCYLGSMTEILQGNIQILHQCIDEDHKAQDARAKLLKAAIVLFTGFPIISALVWLEAFLITKPDFLYCCCFSCYFWLR